MNSTNPKIEGPRHPTPKEYPNFLQFLSQCYGFSDPRWFENDTSYFFGTKPSQLATKWTLKSNGQFTSHVGIFPFVSMVDGRRLKVAGIGSVATHPEFRGRGLMKRLMQHVETRIEKEGFDLSILWGERSLYRPYGYDRGLYLDRFSFKKRTLKYSVLNKGVRPLKPADWPSVQKLFSKHPFRSERTPDYTKSLRLRFGRDLSEPVWVVEESGKIKAYVIVFKGGADGLEAAEWGGEAEDVICLLATVLQNTVMEWLTVPIYPGCDFYAWARENNDNQVRANGSCMIKILNLGKILKVFEPQLKKRYEKMGFSLRRSILFQVEGEQNAGLVLGRNLQVLPGIQKGVRVSLSHEECVRLLFGWGRPSEVLGNKTDGVEFLDLLFPLQWYWWRSDWV
jgi:GNAT superfamily N-acetyltransferase